MDCLIRPLVLYFALLYALDDIFFFFFFNDTAPTEIYTLSLHDALPISIIRTHLKEHKIAATLATEVDLVLTADRKSTRLNSSHITISYAVFCLKKKKNIHHSTFIRNFDRIPLSHHSSPIAAFSMRVIIS